MAEEDRIICSADFLNQLPKGHSYVIADKGIHTFKNLLKPVELFEMSCCIEFMTKKYVIGPVCHMLIKTPVTAPQLQHNGEKFYFCTVNCHEMYKTLNSIP
jgi:YHS domain-containing protein